MRRRSAENGDCRDGGQRPVSEPGVPKVFRRRVEGVPDDLLRDSSSRHTFDTPRLQTPRAKAVTLRPCVAYRGSLMTRVPPPRKLRPDVSVPVRQTPEEVLTIVTSLSGIPVDTLQSPTQLRSVVQVRAAAAHLLRNHCGCQ